MSGSRIPSGGAMPGGLRDLLGEIGDCKRIRSAGRSGTIAERGFASAWAALCAGAPAGRVTRIIVARALVATRIGDLDRATLADLGLDSAAALDVQRGAFDSVTGDLDPDSTADLRRALGDDLPGGPTPAFVAALAAQPRAGATCPGKPRLVLQPAENHAEHCWAVAIYAVLLAPRYDADPHTVFLAGLAHHLHNAAMPDSGFTGEMLLGDRLAPVCAAATARALDELAGPLRREIVAARTILADADTAEGRAFHAADVIDRVVELAQHLRVAKMTLPRLLDEWELVHAGPVKGFHDGVLAEIGLV